MNSSADPSGEAPELLISCNSVMPIPFGVAWWNLYISDTWEINGFGKGVLEITQSFTCSYWKLAEKWKGTCWGLTLQTNPDKLGWSKSSLKQSRDFSCYSCQGRLTLDQWFSTCWCAWLNQSALGFAESFTLGLEQGHGGEALSNPV